MMTLIKASIQRAKVVTILITAFVSVVMSLGVSYVALGMQVATIGVMQESVEKKVDGLSEKIDLYSNTDSELRSFINVYRGRLSAIEATSAESVAQTQRNAGMIEMNQELLRVLITRLGE